MDWIRALTQNHARLESDSDDPLLRPLDLSQPPVEVADRIERWAEQNPRWSIESRLDVDSTLKLHLKRTTKLLRFVDDIQVRIAPRGNGSRLDAESQSRVGKGDLGQNARNLRELTSQLGSDQ